MRRLRRSGVMALMAAVAVAAEAQDSSIGIRSPRSPAFDGERVFTAVVGPPPSGGSWHQVPFDRDVPGNRSRLVLEYTTPDENWNPRRRVVAAVRGSGTVFRATAVLPQGQLFPTTIALPASARHFDPDYYQNPTTIPHGQRVLYRWRREDGTQARTGDVHEFEMPHPLVVAIMGDSYGSGEGAPHTESTLISQVRWADDEGHRSNKSGLRKAVVEFAHAHPELWVRYKHTGISGATLSTDGASGYLTDYNGSRELKVMPIPLPTAPPSVIYLPVPMRPVVRAEAQFTQFERWMAENGYDRTHLLVLSGGGNDAGFVGIIKDALFGSLQFDFGNSLREFRENIATLRDVAANDFKPALNEMIRPRHIVWTTYPDLTQDGNAVPAGIQVSPSLNVGLTVMDLAVGGDDMANARLLLRDELNPAIREICRETMENCRIADVEDAAIGHGINAPASKRWFNTFTDAQDRVQGAIDGSVHPNDDGQELFVAPVVAQIRALYHPRTGSEYRRLRSELLAQEREAAKARAKEKALARAKARRQAEVLRSAERPIVANVRNAKPRVQLVAEQKRRAMALAAQRKAKARSGTRRQLNDPFERRLQGTVPLRLALPSPERLTSASQMLSQAGRHDTRLELESTVNQLRGRQIDPQMLREALEKARGKKVP